MLEEAGLIEGRNLYDIANTQVVHHLNQALKANVMFKKDIDYIVKDEKIVIIDEFTGRMMDGRRWSDGLHQAVEAKEGVTIEPENQTLASITFQNYFRMYPKLSGMTGTAMTEAPEFFDIYKMNVVAIPTNVPVLRIDEDDVFYKTMTEKFAAITEELKQKQQLGQPALVGTISIEKSEMLSEYLRRRCQALGAECPLPRAGGPHRRPGGPDWRGDDRHEHGRPRHRHSARRQPRVPNAGRIPDLEQGAPEYEAQAEKIRAEIVAERQRVLTLAASMSLAPSDTRAGASTISCAAVRGVRATRAYPNSTSVSTTTSCASSVRKRCFWLMNKNLEDGEAIVSPWISKAIETAQKKVEARNYDIRKQVVEFDDVMNDQRKVVYEQRADIMDAESVADVITDMRAETASSIVAVNCPEGPIPSSGSRGPQGEHRGGVRT